MLTITVPSVEFYDRKEQVFIKSPKTVLQLEHSLLSISKWESKWKKPFFNKKEMTAEEVMDYIQCMTLNKNVDPLVYKCLSAENIEEIGSYMKDPMTATTINSSQLKKNSREIITSEIFYYLMATYNIPMECQKWHINRLITLIQVFNEKNKQPKKMSNKDLYAQQRALNSARRRSLHSRG